MPVLQRLCGVGDFTYDGIRVDQPVVLAAVCRPVQVLAQEPQPQFAGEHPCVAARRDRGSRPVSSNTAQDNSLSWVHDRRLKLSLPTQAQVSSMTQTLACTYTGVPAWFSTSKMCTRSAGGLPARLDGLLAADHVGRQRQPAVDVGMSRHHRDQMQVGVLRAAHGRTGRQPAWTTGTGPPDRSAVRPAASPWCSRGRCCVHRAARSVLEVRVGICPQHLHGVRPARRVDPGADPAAVRA